MIFGGKKDSANPFKDVNARDEYYEAVTWALQKGIAAGVEPDRFEPHSICTRGEALTFLWRALGCPAVKTENSPFIDEMDSEHLQGVLWAVENKISNPISERIFAANASCSRIQFVTFLHRSQGSPKAVKRDCKFVDVNGTEYYYETVLWAVEQGITDGVTEGAFGPDNICNRAQVIDFLYRYFAK